jgi:precorrin-2 dehydrogenase / sirohydrochlorin ferrochelatase
MTSTVSTERLWGQRPDSQAEADQPSALFPAFLKLAGRKCLVVGAGKVGQSKIEGLLTTGAALIVVAPRASESVQAWAEAGDLRWSARAFEPADLDGVLLAVVATSSPLLNEWVCEEARRRGVLCNVVDDPAHCDFYYPAVVRRGALQIAISTDGKSPALAQRLRKQLEDEFEPRYADWMEHLGRLRQQLFGQAMDPEERRLLLHEMASAAGYERFVRTRELGAEAGLKRGERR